MVAQTNERVVMEHLPNAPDDSRSSSPDPMERIAAIFDRKRRQAQEIKQFTLELLGPPPSREDVSGYLGWVSSCAVFYHEQGDPVSMMIVLGVFLEDHPALEHLPTHPDYPERLGRAYSSGPDAIRRTLFELAGLAP